jgi:hypothetical protein
MRVPLLAHDASHLNIVFLLESVSQLNRGNGRPPLTALTNYLLRSVQLFGFICTCSCGERT